MKDSVDLKEWMKYLESQDNEDLLPIMEKFFNDDMDIEELDYEVSQLDLMNRSKYYKDKAIKQIMEDDQL